MLFDEKLSHYLGIKRFQDHVISRDEFTKICGIILWKMFPFGLVWVNKMSHKNCLTLSHVKQ